MIFERWAPFSMKPVCCLRMFSKPIYFPNKLRWCRNWSRHCATSRKVAGSIPDGVTGIFRWYNLSGRPIAVQATQPLTEMDTGIFPLWACNTPQQGLLSYEASCILWILLLLAAIEFSLGGSSPYTSTDKTNNIHKRNNTKHSTNNTKHIKYKYTYY